MINILKKNECCGCSACAQRCPHNCIEMREDEKGFYYPFVNTEQCNNCGLCNKVCPSIHLLNQNTNSNYKIFAAINSDQEIRIKSSSGGIFYLIANYTISQGGVVFGARFDEHWNVIHSFTETKEGLEAFMGSKYIQSKIENSYQQVLHFLKEGRYVLFSGTLCQIEGLNLLLRKKYPNLLTVAIACHSVSSPKVWKEYLKGLKLNKITNINFRDKKISWEKYGLKINYGDNKVFFQTHDENAFLQLFLHGLTTRPSCFNCPAKNTISSADIIIGDCWGINQILPDFKNDHKGISFIQCQTNHGFQIINKIDLTGRDIPYEHVIKYNGGLTQRLKMPNNYDLFWSSFLQCSNKLKILTQFSKPFLPSPTIRIKKYVSKLTYHIFNKSFV